MKKNLRNILVLSLGLITTIASAQWSADSRTRIDNTDSENRTATQRLTVGADWGGIHASYDVNYDLNNGTATHDVYEAYASTDLMGFGTLTVGRQDLSFGSGALISSNNWGMNRYTNDGVSLSMELASVNITAGTMGGIDTDANYMNASTSLAGAEVNILMMNDGDNSAHGYDISYAMGDFSMSVSMNADYSENEYNSYGLSYQVFDNLSASVSQTSNEGGFSMANTALSGGWANGNIGYLGAGDEDRAMGISYDLGDITLGYTTHNVTNEDEGEESDYEATEMHIGYSLNDNANISISKMGGTDTEMTWLTISITP
ncbi:MAG: hypothetical protein ACKVG7_03205 [Flavobacteriales bacterium]